MNTAIWLRVSDPDNQTTENQLMPLQQEAERRGWEIVKVYDIGVSAFQGAHRKALSLMYADARRGLFTILLVWALDRLSREGALATLQIWHKLANMGVTIISLREPWVEASGDFKDVLLAITGWVAKMESAQRSERVQAGMERARASGKHVGRPAGKKDKRKRKKAGYYIRWAK